VGVSRERVRQIEKRALQKINLVLSGKRNPADA
jgi:DNA-directed RNA polymerase sigma subunit (sigma70/sigma32)